MSLERKYLFQVPALPAVVQEAIVPDLLESRREYMHQVTPDKFGILKSDRSAGSSGDPAPGRKCHLMFIHGQDAAVCYGNLVCIPPQVFNGIARSVERLFDVRTPVLFVKTVTKSSPLIRIPEFPAGRRKLQLSLFIERIKTGKVFPLEFIPEYPDGDKKVFLCFSYLMVRSQSAAGNDTVHMHMVANFLIPGMEYLDDPGSCAEILSV